LRSILHGAIGLITGLTISQSCKSQNDERQYRLRNQMMISSFPGTIQLVEHVHQIIGDYGALDVHRQALTREDVLDIEQLELTAVSLLVELESLHVALSKRGSVRRLLQPCCGNSQCGELKRFR